MKMFFLADEMTPHPLVLAIIAIAIAVMCMGGCTTSGCGDCMVAKTVEGRR